MLFLFYTSNVFYDSYKIYRCAVGPVNPITIKGLLDCGVLFLVDLLHTYTIKLQQVLHIPLSLPAVVQEHNQKENNQETERLKRILESWARTTREYSKQRSFNMSCVFQPQECKLILCLLQFCEMLAISSHDPCGMISAVETAQKQIKEYSHDTGQCKKDTSKVRRMEENKVESDDKKHECDACAAKILSKQETEIRMKQMALTPTQVLFFIKI